MSVPDPQVEFAIKTCLDAVKDGASPKTIAPEDLKALGEEVRGDFTNRMHSPGTWDGERAKLLQMATYLGQFARFFADCDLSKDITRKHVWKAAAIVQANCPVGAKVNGTRAWCLNGKFGV